MVGEYAHKFYTPRDHYIPYAPPASNLNHRIDKSNGSQSYRMMKKKDIPHHERSRQHKLKELEKKRYYSFNQNVDGPDENKKAIMAELLKMYPHGDMTKTKLERQFKRTTPQQKVRGHNDEMRRSDMFMKVKGEPRAPFIPTHIPKLEEQSIESASLSKLFLVY